MSWRNLLIGGILLVLFGGVIFFYINTTKKSYTNGVFRLIDVLSQEIPYDIKWSEPTSQVIVSGIIDISGVQTSEGRQYISVVVPKGGKIARLHIFFPDYKSVLVYKTRNEHLGSTQDFNILSINTLSPFLLDNHQGFFKVDMDENTFSAYEQQQLWTGKIVLFGPVTQMIL